MRVIISVGLLIICVSITGTNWIIAMKWWTAKKRSTMIPFIGGVFGFIGLLISPWQYALALCWIPLVVDIGCSAMLVGLIQELIRKK